MSLRRVQTVHYFIYPRTAPPAILGYYFFTLARSDPFVAWSVLAHYDFEILPLFVPSLIYMCIIMLICLVDVLQFNVVVGFRQLSISFSCWDDF